MYSVIRLASLSVTFVSIISTNQPTVQFYGGNFLTPADFQGDSELASH